MKITRNYLKSIIQECLNEILSEQDITNPVASDPKVQIAVKNKAVADRKVADAEITALNLQIRNASNQERQANDPKEKEALRDKTQNFKDQLAAAKLRKTTANKMQTAAK